MWHWWINFVGGLAGALLFAIPATLTLPALFIAWMLRPNALFEPGIDASETLWVGALLLIVTEFLNQLQRTPQEDA